MWVRLIKRILSYPVGLLAIALYLLVAPVALLWAVLMWANESIGAPLPTDLWTLRLPHWYVGRLWSTLRFNRRLSWR